MRRSPSVDIVSFNHAPAIRTPWNTYTMQPSHHLSRVSVPVAGLNAQWRCPAAAGSDPLYPARSRASIFAFWISSSDASSMPAMLFLAFFVAKISSSNFNWRARVSRFCVAWIKKTIRNVTIVVPVLMTSCQVSLKPNKRTVIAQTSTTATASRKVVGRPEIREVATASRANQLRFG